MLARRFELRVQASELVVRPVDVRGEGTEFVPVLDVDVPREVSRRDRGQARIDPLDGTDHRPRQDEAE